MYETFITQFYIMYVGCVFFCIVHCPSERDELGYIIGRYGIDTGTVTPR